MYLTTFYHRRCIGSGCIDDILGPVVRRSCISADMADMDALTARPSVCL
jgi:hypothetical protein